MADQLRPTIDLPRLALQIGVTGHRQLNLDKYGESLLTAHIVSVLQNIDSAYRQLAASEEAVAVFADAKPLTPRLLSPLAEGADSIAAQAALSVDYELHCPLPFPREVYADDFQGEALQTFTELLAQADRVLELDGTRTHKDPAYRYVGHFVLRHANIVLAIWNGKEDDSSPGTSGMVAAALRLQLPVLWIQADRPDTIRYHDPRHRKQLWQTWDNIKLADLLRWRLLPPDQQEDEDEQPGRSAAESNFCAAYRSHAEPQRNLLGTVYRTLFSWFGKRSIKGMFGNPYRKDAEFQWQTLADAAHPALPVGATTQAHFIRSDSLASYYADQYRGTFVLTFTLGAVAVLLALLGAPFEGAAHANIIYAPLEFITIGVIAFLIRRGRKLDLHQRWVDLRLLAERLRQYAFLAPVGGVSQSSQAVFHRHGDHSYAVVDWLVRTLGRAEGIPAVSFNADYRKAYHGFLMAMIKDQVGYHENNHKRNHRIVHALHVVNWALLLIIVGACVVHIVWHEPWVAVTSTMIAAVLPAFGAAIAGVLSQGEFERIAKRSKGMAKHLNDIAKHLQENPDATVLELTLQAQLAIDTMSQELYDWRVIFRAKPLEQHA